MGEDRIIMVSVILPVLNGESTIEMSIKSVLNQTYTDYELLIVDNGSSDHTVAICSRYCKNDNRIKILHCSIPGVVAGRKLGVTNAKGKYLAFIDADDEYKPEMLEIMVQALEKSNADIASCGYEIVYQGRERERCIPLCNGVLDSKHYFEMLFQKGTLGFLWNKLYKSSVWRESDNPDGMEVCEDTYINCSLLRTERTVVVVPQCLYQYYENPFSVTRTIDKKIDEHENWKYLVSYKKIMDLVADDEEKKRCVERSIWWVIKLGVEELNISGAVGISAKKKLCSEMKKNIIPVIRSGEDLRFKLSYIKTYILYSRK